MLCPWVLVYYQHDDQTKQTARCSFLPSLMSTLWLTRTYLHHLSPNKLPWGSTYPLTCPSCIRTVHSVYSDKSPDHQLVIMIFLPQYLSELRAGRFVLVRYEDPEYFGRVLKSGLFWPNQRKRLQGEFTSRTVIKQLNKSRMNWSGFLIRQHKYTLVVAASLDTNSTVNYQTKQRKKFERIVHLSNVWESVPNDFPAIIEDSCNGHKNKTYVKRKLI